jgi:SEC-C motif-containing protein
MRSRYTAYTLGAIDYIVDTHLPETRESLDREASSQWAQESKWLGLEIVTTQAGQATDNEGGVEFIARFSQDGTEYEHHENSRFLKVDGKWYFSEGRIVPKTVVNTAPTVGRNDPCPCGSGKKFKKCCGR